MAMQLANTDINAALDLVNKYTSGRLKDNALQNIGFQWPRPIRKRPWPMGNPCRGQRAE